MDAQIQKLRLIVNGAVRLYEGQGLEDPGGIGGTEPGRSGECSGCHRCGAVLGAGHLGNQGNSLNAGCVQAVVLDKGD